MRSPMTPGLPPRPDPPLGVVEHARRWLRYIGPSRALASALAVAAVGAGGFWLLRTPASPPEAALPRAVASSSTSVGTTAQPDAVSTSTAPPMAVVVHVAGAVAQPGVYTLPSGSRVDDAVDAAGGASTGADPGALNLAALVADGQRVYVPMAGEQVAADPLPPPAGSSPAPSAGPVDVNRATAAELEGLPGVGPATAAAIVRHRDENGPFVTVDGLLDVTGIGPAKLAAFRDLVVV